MRLDIPEPALVLLVGPSGAGKSTFAQAHFAPTEVVSSDVARAMLSDDPGDQGSSAEAFHILALLVNGRLKRRLTTVVDATNLRAANRKSYRHVAARYGVPTIALAFDLAPDTYHARNRQRSGRFVGADVVDDQAARMPKVRDELALEGYSALVVLDEQGLGDELVIERVRTS